MSGFSSVFLSGFASDCLSGFAPILLSGIAPVFLSEGCTEFLPTARKRMSQHQSVQSPKVLHVCRAETAHSDDTLVVNALCITGTSVCVFVVEVAAPPPLTVEVEVPVLVAFTAQCVQSEA